VTTRDAAGALRGASIGVPHELLPALAADEHYQADLVGMVVVNRGGDVLGTVVDFVESGAHPIVRVARAEGGERLIPWIEQFIDRVDVAARRIDVDWPVDY
jgi:16S rRNA processing protein RimM